MLFAIPDIPLRQNIPVECINEGYSKGSKEVIVESSLNNYWLVAKKTSYASAQVNTSFNTNIYLNEELISALPHELTYLTDSIENSKSILLLEDDWDTEGSLQYSQSTWISAIKFLVDYATTLFFDFNIKIEIPKIYEGPKSSIDMIWETSTYRLVVNIEKEGINGMFYADNYKDQKTEGTFSLKKFNKFLLPVAIQV